MVTALYIILAILGLSFLVFIHELGHYIVARRNGMRVEVFSIGLGKPIVTWMHKGVKWQLCPLIFGGYVRIAGMEKEGKLEPHEVRNGFYSKRPWARIKVALAGPVVNLVFAVIAFGMIWLMGGRDKPFAQFTHYIGSVDRESEVYQKGLRPGDSISELNGKPYKGFEDLIFASIANGRDLTLKGDHVNYFQESKAPFAYRLTPYDSPSLRKGMKTIGIMSPASYLIYQEMPDLFQEGPLSKSGIQNKDRVVWVDGELIFSDQELRQVLNSGRVLIHYVREGEVHMAKVPRLSLGDLRLSPEQKEDFEDWQYEAGLGRRAGHHFFIPYALSSNLIVQGPISYVGEHSHFETVHSTSITSDLDQVLEPGDQILSIEGSPVSTVYEFMKRIQTRQVQIIVERDPSREKMLWNQEDEHFLTGTKWSDLLPIISSIGSTSPTEKSGNFHLLSSVTPLKRKDLTYSPVIQEKVEKSIEKQKEQIEKIRDPEEKEQALKAFESTQDQYALGALFEDRTVIYNPGPFTLFGAVFKEIARNLTGLISGYLSPKHFGGPLMIVQLMHHSFGIGVKEALFWLGAISLNLGIFNLLPIPILDGGHICFSLIEWVRKKPLKSSTMRKAIIPFFILLIGFFIYLTYNDLIRIFGRLF